MLMISANYQNFFGTFLQTHWKMNHEAINGIVCFCRYTSSTQEATKTNSRELKQRCQNRETSKLFKTLQIK